MVTVDRFIPWIHLETPRLQPVSAENPLPLANSYSQGMGRGTIKGRQTSETLLFICLGRQEKLFFPLFHKRAITF